jgi:hypothetical protein
MSRQCAASRPFRHTGRAEHNKSNTVFDICGHASCRIAESVMPLSAIRHIEHVVPIPEPSGFWGKHNHQFLNISPYWNCMKIKF